jgi:hypothetical protein
LLGNPLQRVELVERDLPSLILCEIKGAAPARSLGPRSGWVWLRLFCGPRMGRFKS